MFVEVGVGEEDGDLLLAAAVEEAEAPGRGLVVGVEAAVELGAGGAAQAGHLGRRGRVLADAQVQVPLFEVDGEVAVEEAGAGRARWLDLPDGAGDQQPDADALPLGQAVSEDAVQRVLVGGHGEELVDAVGLLGDFAAGQRLCGGHSVAPSGMGPVGCWG